MYAERRSTGKATGASLSHFAQSLSRSLSAAAVLGLFLVIVLPHAPRSPLLAYFALERPVEIVRATPVPLGAVEAGETAVELAARRSRAKRPQPQSDAEGKFGIPEPAQKSAAAVPAKEAIPAEPKSEPPEPPPPLTVWPDTDIIAGLRECLKELAPIAAEIDIAPPVRLDQCGAAAPVMLRRVGSGAGKVELHPPAMLNCAMVARLHAWVERTLQPAAAEMLGTSVARLRNASGYVCRNRNGSLKNADRLSEHAFANAIDISAFVMADGRTIDVERHWGPTERDIREQQRLAAELREKQAKEAKEAKEAKRAKEAKEGKQASEEEDDERESSATGKGAKGKEAVDSKASKLSRRERQEAERRQAKEAAQDSAALRKLGRGAPAQPDKSAANAKSIPVMPAAGREERAKEADFLRRLHKGACGTFGTVLGPEANDAHRNHFHFDLAERRRNAFCQ